MDKPDRERILFVSQNNYDGPDKPNFWNSKNNNGYNYINPSQQDI